MIKKENKVVFFAGILVFVSIFFFVAGKFMAAETSNVTVYVPGTQEDQVPASGGSGGNALLLLNKAPESVAPDQETTPSPDTITRPVAKPVVQNNPTTVTTLLPLAVADLSQKIPEFGATLSKLGVNNAADVENLKNYSIFLPGIKEITGTDFSNLTKSQKNQIPTEILFVSLGNGKIDALAKLDFSDSSNVIGKRTNVFTGETMRLIVKPKLPAKSVSGYVLFKSQAGKIAYTGKYIPSFNIALASLAGSKANSAVAPATNVVKPSAPSQSSSQFVVLSFSYNDDDKDGIYVADIKAPVVTGEYEIVTKIDDGAGIPKVINFTTLVDPEGYIYEQTSGKELRINNATVSLYHLNNANQYELWNANEYGQENPQVTGATGNYSFLVPAGTYYLTVKTSGYYLFQSDAFSVAEGKEIHANIALKREFDLSSVLNWNIILIAILFCLVIYNFYMDIRRRKK